MPTPDHKNTKLIFDQLALIAAGHPTLDALAAVQDLYVAMICIATPDPATALEFARMAHPDINATIQKNFYWYNGQGATSVNPQPPVQS